MSGFFAQYWLLLVLIAGGAYFIFRFQIDCWYHERHLRRLVDRMAKETAPSHLRWQLQERYTAFCPSFDETGWHVTVRMPDWPGATWPPFVQRIDDLLRTRMADDRRLASHRSYDKESYYQYAGNKSADIAWVAAQLLNRLLVPHHV